MEDTRKYKRNPYLIALGAIGGISIVLSIISTYIFTIEFLLFDLAGQEINIMIFLFVIVLLLSGQAVYLDARSIDAGAAAPQQKTFRALTWTPASWGGTVFFLWIIVFPYYLYKREEIYWQNITVEYSALKTIEREITKQAVNPQPRPDSPKKEYSENIGTCPRCDTPYPLRMLERSNICSRCGGLLIEVEE